MICQAARQLGGMSWPPVKRTLRQGFGQKSLCSTGEISSKKASLWGFMLGWFQTTGQLFLTHILKIVEGGDQKVTARG